MTVELALERDASYLREVWAWFGVGILVFFLRFGVRIRMVGIKGFEGDDYVSFCTLACYALDAVLVDICYKHGTNLDVKPDMLDQLTDEQVARLRYGSKCQIAAWYTYTALIWSMKATMLFFYRRLTFGLWQNKTLQYLSWLCAGSYVAVLLTITLSCHPYEDNWQVRPLPGKQCTLKLQNFLVTGVLNVITDGAILYIPLPMLRKLNAPLRKKMVIAVLLCSGLFVITAAIIRAALTLGSAPSNVTVNRWGVRETIVGIIAINAPILRPLFSYNFWTRGPIVQASSGLSDSFTPGRGGKSGTSGLKSAVSRLNGTTSSRPASAGDGVCHAGDEVCHAVDGSDSREHIIREHDDGIALGDMGVRRAAEDEGDGMGESEGRWRPARQGLGDEAACVERGFDPGTPRRDEEAGIEGSERGCRGATGSPRQARG